MPLYSIRCGESGISPGSGNVSPPSSYSGGGSSGGGYVNTPQVWIAPESFETEGTTFTHYASPYNPDDVGIIPRARNEMESEIEKEKQEGPIGGGGFLGLFPAKPGSPAYNAYIAAVKAREAKDARENDKYNPENTGIEPLTNNEISTDIEIDKQTQDSSFWERLANAIREGYEKEPEDVNVFQKSIDNLAGIISPSNYPLLLIGGGILLVILIIK